MTPAIGGARIVILYGIGGLSDVGRHAVQVAVQEQFDKFKKVTVLTQHPELLDESNWNCGCPDGHSFSDEEKTRFGLIKVKSWKDDTLKSHFEDATCVVSCVGNRQPTFMNVTPASWCSHEANQMVIDALKQHSPKATAVVISSMGVNEDWPCMEWHWAGKIMNCLFRTFARKPYKDLTNTENAYRASGLDYLLVRPVGIGDEVVPQNKWRIQTEKYKDKSLDTNMAKLDVARFMVQECLERTKRDKDAVVIGGVPPEEGASE